MFLVSFVRYVKEIPLPASYQRVPMQNKNPWDPKGTVVYLANPVINKVSVLHEVEAGTV